eukprot:6181160-Pleurochrysis_carterae.AAC.3
MASAASAAGAVPGYLDSENGGALDWREGLLAYGIQNLVAVVEASSTAHCLQLLHTLDGHSGRVCEVSSDAITAIIK